MIARPTRLHAALCDTPSASTTTPHLIAAGAPLQSGPGPATASTRRARLTPAEPVGGPASKPERKGPPFFSGGKELIDSSERKTLVYRNHEPTRRFTVGEVFRTELVDIFWRCIESGTYSTEHDGYLVVFVAAYEPLTEAQMEEMARRLWEPSDEPVRIPAWSPR